MASPSPHLTRRDDRPQVEQEQEPASRAYEIPSRFDNLDDVPSKERAAAPGDTYSHKVRHASRHSPERLRKEGSTFPPENDYDIPDDWINLDELAAHSPVRETDPPASQSSQPDLEEIRSRVPQKNGPLKDARGETHSTEEEEENADDALQQASHKPQLVSRLVTEIYTVSHLILFSLFGTLARLGLTALATYNGSPVTFPVLWANVGGSLIMGFLAEDRKLFRYEWGRANLSKKDTKRDIRSRQDARSDKRADNDEEKGAGAAHNKDKVFDWTKTTAEDAAAAKKAHLAVKKTIPLYIGLATGFCGSFTSFSSFIRDAFLATSNDLVPTTHRNGGYSFLALLAVLITTISLSLSALFVGAHLAAALHPITPSLTTRRTVDQAAVFLGWGCWLGAILLSIFPPKDAWRGQVAFALVFAPLGCLTRFYLALLLNAKVPSFPLGTFAANVGGTAVLGLAYDIAHARIGGVVGCQVLQGIEDGFCGCLTTVSTWVTELSSLRRRHAYQYGATSVLISWAVLIAIMGGLRWSQGFDALLCRT